MGMKDYFENKLDENRVLEVKNNLNTFVKNLKEKDIKKEVKEVIRFYDMLVKKYSKDDYETIPSNLKKNDYFKIISLIAQESGEGKFLVPTDRKYFLNNVEDYTIEYFGLEEAITPGMMNALNKATSNKIHKVCDKCGFNTPKYQGRYPKECPACGDIVDDKDIEVAPDPNIMNADVVEALKAADKKVIDAFYNKESAEGKMLSTDGKKLEKFGMGGQDIAHWDGYDVVITATMDVKSTDDIMRYIKKSFPPKAFSADTPISDFI